MTSRPRLADEKTVSSARAQAKRPERSTDEVLDDHLELRQQGNVEQDIGRNYAEDVVVLSGCGVHRGHDGVRQTAQILQHYLGGEGTYDITNRLVADDVAFIEWRASGPGRAAQTGADSFLIRAGEIVSQTIHYSAKVDRRGERPVA